GLEQIGAELADVRLVGLGQIVLVDEQGALSHDQCAAARALPGGAEVEADLDDLTVVGDPLCFGALGDERVVQCRAELDPGRLGLLGPADDPGQGGGQRLGGADPGGQPAAGGPADGAAGRVEPQGVEAGQVDVLGAGVFDRGIGQVSEVEGGDGGGDLIGVDGGHLRAHSGEGDGIGADPAAEVGDAQRRL